MHYRDFCPPGKPGVKFQPKVEVDPTNLASRRAHMEAFFKHLGTYDEAKLGSVRAKAEEMVSGKLLQRGMTRVGIRYFEFSVDKIVWYLWFKEARDAGKVVPQWPWDDCKLLADDLSEGASTVCAKFKDDADNELAAIALTEDMQGLALQLARREKGPAQPVGVSGSGSGSGSGYGQPEPSMAMVVAAPAHQPLPPAQGLSSSRWATPAQPMFRVAASSAAAAAAAAPAGGGGQLFPGYVPDYNQRLSSWEAMMGSPVLSKVITGPYEISLPKWLAFESLVLGPGGSQLRAINNAMIDPDLTVTWAMSSSGPEQYAERLIIGPSEIASAELAKRRSHREKLTILWVKIIFWAELVWRGLPARLDIHLDGQSKIGTVANVNMAPGSSLDKVYREAVDSVPSTLVRVRKFAEELPGDEARLVQLCGEIMACSESSKEHTAKQEDLDDWVMVDGLNNCHHRIAWLRYVLLGAVNRDQAAAVNYEVSRLELKFEDELELAKIRAQRAGGAVVEEEGV
ncbi:hypothetical protein BGZ63DRAFT_425978 [Mariannaea sp. PMI_226]|nr:hypothetical protein BGZ63DRAFT_425978 [Mariannaea sp. PMI_226]